MAKQRYYWMKLKTSFLTSNKVDFLMSQPEGSNYVMIYQMLVLKAINTGGKLAMQINGISVPYTIEKIKRDLKFFNIDTIRTAITLLLNLSLLKKDEDGCFYITDFENLVGSETKWAVWKRNQRQNTGQLVDKSLDNVQRDVQHLVDNVHFSLDNVQQDIDIDIDTEVDIDIYKNDKIDKEDKYDKANSHFAEFEQNKKNNINFLTKELIKRKFIENDLFEINEAEKILPELKKLKLIKDFDTFIRVVNYVLKRYETYKNNISDKISWFSCSLINNLNLLNYRNSDEFKRKREEAAKVLSFSQRNLENSLMSFTDAENLTNKT